MEIMDKHFSKAKAAVTSLALAVATSPVVMFADDVETKGTSMAKNILTSVTTWIHPWTIPLAIIGIVLFVFGTKKLKETGAGLAIGGIAGFFLTTSTVVTALQSTMSGWL